jgi:MoaA/NifB/PqqE/SkfB family radical SAM enzyme
LHEAGISLIAFSGGEPILRPDLFQLIEHCRRLEIQCAVRSNATLITDKDARRLAELGLAVAGISLDGSSPQTHDKIRGNGSFWRTIEGVCHLVTAGVPVNIEVVLSRWNAAEHADFVQLAEDLGSKEINFSALVPRGRASWLKDAVLDHRLWARTTSSLYKASMASRLSVTPACSLIGPCCSCVEPNITADGWLTPCYLSDRRLLPILDTPATMLAQILRDCRHDNLDTCGRKRWIRRPRRMIPTTHPEPSLL